MKSLKTFFLLAFITIPIIELYLLISIGKAIGSLNTILIIIITGVIGSSMVRHQGIHTLELIKQDMASGKFPGDRILSGLFILVGGVLLITPGVFTDFIGFMLMIPGNRRLLVSYLKNNFHDKLNNSTGNGMFFTNADNIKNDHDIEL